MAISAGKVITWILCGFAATFAACTTSIGLDMADKPTCGGPPPTTFRLACTYSGLGFTLLCLVCAGIFSIRGRPNGTLFALLFVGGAFAAAFLGWFVQVLSAVLC